GGSCEEIPASYCGPKSCSTRRFGSSGGRTSPIDGKRRRSSRALIKVPAVLVHALPTHPGALAMHEGASPYLRDWPDSGAARAVPVHQAPRGVDCLKTGAYARRGVQAGRRRTRRRAPTSRGVASTRTTSKSKRRFPAAMSTGFRR
ncbi:MAG: hypothetical protein ACI8W7_004519, partial [Gammaproteobacteria bacterium]